MYIYTIAMECYTRKITDQTWNLNDSHIDEVFKSRKAVDKYLKNKDIDIQYGWNMRMFPYETYSKKIYQDEKWEEKQVYEIRQWEL